MRIIIKLITLFLAGSLLSVSAQINLTSSPYSMYGLGEITKGLYGQNASMGGVSTGMRDEWLINTENPAGLTDLDSCKLYAEVSAFTRFEYYKSKGKSNNATSGNLSEFALAGRLIPKWYVAVGLKPYSSVGYYFTSTEPVEGTSGTVTSTYTGNGSINKVYLTNSLKLTNRFSVGINLSYIFGTLDFRETQASMSMNQNCFTSNFYADFGVQYHRPLSREAYLTVGAVYGYSQQIKLDNNYTLTSTYSQVETSKRKITQYLPQTIGVGTSLQYKKWTYALDYDYTQYSKISSNASGVKFVDAHTIQAGIKYFPDGFSSDNYWKKVGYKAGISVGNHYMKLGNSNGYNFRGSIGFDLPVLNGRLNPSLFYDATYFDTNIFIKHIYGITVTYTLSERFYKVKL
ncbi:MAG: hypothetical protein LUD02_03135 [Tannerellaceae bacterium]|nr:hypothetical protein [Tannerellaceae bacterium]